jgi:hypothetical protein
MNIQYNALEYAHQLEGAGVPQAQAEVHAHMLGRVLSDCVVAPADLHALGGDLTHQIVETETRLRAAIKETGACLRGEIAEAGAHLRGGLAEVEARLRGEIVEVEARLRGEIVEVEARLRGEIVEVEARLGAKIDIGLERLSKRIDKLDDAIGYMKWMNALTLALLVGLIVKSTFI